MPSSCTLRRDGPCHRTLAALVAPRLGLAGWVDFLVGNEDEIYQNAAMRDAVDKAMCEDVVDACACEARAAIQYLDRLDISPPEIPSEMLQMASKRWTQIKAIADEAAGQLKREASEHGLGTLASEGPIAENYRATVGSKKRKLSHQ